jgi:hypothetical protein
MRPIKSRLLAVAATAAILAPLTGCGSSNAHYAPSASLARQSLEAALTAWRDGKPAGRIEGTQPPVSVIDSAWTNGQKLGDYSIQGEEAGDGRHRFSVRLTMAEPKGEKQVYYVVHGRDPVFVYRDDDFTRSMNMDDNPDGPRSKPRPPLGRRR